MALESSPKENCDKSSNIIFHYRLDFQQFGNQHRYIWRRQPLAGNGRRRIAMLIDLNNVFVPEFEIEKMVAEFLAPADTVFSIAFSNCHAGNQQDIKRRLKAGDVLLYSNTAFFSNTDAARQWLEHRCLSR